MKELREIKYPELYYASSTASMSAQKKYYSYQASYVALIIIAAILGYCTDHLSGPCKVWAILTTIAIALGLILLWIIRAERHDKTWFDCRAIAETIKSSSWMLMMKTHPYTGNWIQTTKKYNEEINRITEVCKNNARQIIKGSKESGHKLTEEMKGIWKANLRTKMEIYNSKRLKDQIQWYRDKSKYHTARANNWFWTIAGLQITALILMVIKLGINIPTYTTLIAAFTTAFIAWANIKRYEELSLSYAIAANELSKIDALLIGIRTAGQFEKAVMLTEKAISREHNSWYAHRSALVS